MCVSVVVFFAFSLFASSSMLHLLQNKVIRGGSKKSKLLILSECVNKTEKIGGM